MKIGIQGEAGSYSAEAAAAMAPDSELLSCATFEDVHARLRDGSIDAALLPFENTLVGPIAEQYDLLLKFPAEIEREFILRIEHQLIGVPGADLSTVREVLSHAVALQQCRRFFARHPQIRSTPFYDTAGSVAHVMRERNPAIAAIASRQAAALHSGQILEADVQDDAENRTRFLMLRRPGEVVAAPNATR